MDFLLANSYRVDAIECRGEAHSIKKCHSFFVPVVCLFDCSLFNLSDFHILFFWKSPLNYGGLVFCFLNFLNSGSATNRNYKTFSRWEMQVER